MFSKIFSFELSYWFNRWQFYVYAFIAFFATYLFVLLAGGLAASNTATVTSLVHLNSPIGIMGFVNGMTTLLYFFLPAIFGTAIAKDFNTQTHQVLYSYPFSKPAYFFAKFSSAFVIAFLVLLGVGVGAYLGFITPGINKNMLGPNSFSPYLHTYLVYIIPNLFVIGSIIFILVSVTRNAAVGYIVVVILLFQDSLAGLYFSQLDSKELSALLDPFGQRAMVYYAEKWTIFEQNNNPLPFEKYVIYNRLLWMGIGIVFMLAFYRLFQLAQQPVSLFRRKGDAPAPNAKRKFGRPVNLNLPAVKLRSDLTANLTAIWHIAKVHFRYVIGNPAFIVVALLGIMFLVIVYSVSGIIIQTETYALTDNMLRFGRIFHQFIIILTFLMAGFVIHRERASKIEQLVDASMISNTVQLAGKFLSILLMQALLLMVVMVSGIAYQLFKSFYDIDIGLYLFDLLCITWLVMIPWAALAFLVHKLIPNKYVGFIVLIALWIGWPFLDNVGIEQSIYIYNRGGTSVGYSAMDGYGNRFNGFLAYRSYWLLASVFLMTLSYFLWRRGYVYTFKDRWNTFLNRIKGLPAVLAMVALLGFLSAGFFIYRETNIKDTYTSSKEAELERVDWEKKYKKYSNVQQPRITDVSVKMDLLPQEKSFSASGDFLMKNKSQQNVDTLIVNYGGHEYTFDFGREVDTIFRDSKLNFAAFKLKESLLPGDSMSFHVDIQSEKNTYFSNKAQMSSNGTFLNSSLFPSFGYSPAGELTDDETREKYDLPPKERMSPPTDTAALANTYISSDADWVNFEAVVSTDPDQIAIAPGYLQKEWEENGRKYYHYKMDVPMLNFYNFVSGRYEVMRDKWKDINLEIYYHKGHEYNLDRMMSSLKKGMDYYTENYSPYQHKQVRIIEFPRLYGTFAQSFANTIPFSESIGFVAQVNDDKSGGVDYPFSVTAHELAHQWWAHQVIGANVQGATVMSESLSEYSSLKVLEKEYGKEKMHLFLKDALDKYLLGRASEQKKEKPLMYNENQAYIHYNKGSLVLYSMSDYLGEEKFNKVLSEYIDSVAFQEAPYTTSLELVGMLREATPDSLKYLIKDMFETITLYNNKVTNAEVEELDGGKHKVKMKFEVRKYRADDKGKRLYADEGDNPYFELNHKNDTVKSLPLKDYIEIGVFGDGGKELYLQKHKITQIFDSIEIVVDTLPASVGIDPYNKLIDAFSADNKKDF